MARHVIVGAGTNGSQLAELLVGRGEEVVLVSRRGRGPDRPGITCRPVDAADAGALGAAAEGASVLYNCANPDYLRWQTDWPPMARAMLEVAERSGAVLVTLSNLYGYGPVAGPMTEDLPLAAVSTRGQVRAQMWRDALAAHEAGRIRCVEVRASDFFGPGLTDQGYLGERAVPRILAGKTVRAIGDVDAPHSWTYVPDTVEALALVGSEEAAWGRPWHVPTAPARSIRQMVTAMANAAGVQPSRVSGVSRGVLRALGIVSAQMRGLAEVAYQFEHPFIVDSSAFTDRFGVAATPVDDAVGATVAWWRTRLAAPGR